MHSNEGGPTSPAFLDFDLLSLWHHRRFLVLVVFASTALGAMYVFMASPTYEVQTRLVVQPETLAIQLTSKPYKDPDFLATQAEVMHSPMMIRQTLEQAPVTVPSGYSKGPVTYVLESLTVTPIVATDVLKVSYRGRDSGEVKRFVACLIASFQAHVGRQDHSRGSAELELLIQREEELRKELEGVQAEYAEFRLRSPLIGQGKDNYNIAEDLYAYVGQQLAQARARKVDLRNKLQAYRMAQHSQLASATRSQALEVTSFKTTEMTVAANAPGGLAENSGVINVLRSDATAGADDLVEIQMELSRARVHAQELSHRFGPKHPERKGAEAQVAYWEGLLQERVLAASEVLSREADIAEQSEQNLQKDYEQEWDTIKALDTYLVEDAAWHGKIKWAEAVYEATLSQLKEYQTAQASLVGGRTSVRVNVLDGPELQEELIWPKKKPLLGLSAALGLLGGALAVAFGVRLKRRVRQVEPR